MPGCFSPTEIFAAYELGADIVKVFPATSLGPQFIKDVRAPLPQVKLMPTGGVSLDNARRLDSRRRRGGRRRIGAARRQGDRRAAASTRLRRTPGALSRTSRRRDSRSMHGSHGCHLRRNHAAPQPARVRALLPVARRCRRPSAAAKPTSRSASRISGSTAATSRACRSTRSARRRCGRCGRRGSTRRTCCAAAIASGSTSRKAGASQRASTVVYDRAHSAISETGSGGGALGRRDAGAAWFHVTGITPALGANCAAATRACDRRGQAGRRARQRRPQLPQEAVDRGAGAGDDAAADARRRRRRSPTRKTCRRCSACRWRAPT